MGINFMSFKESLVCSPFPVEEVFDDGTNEFDESLSHNLEESRVVEGPTPFFLLAQSEGSTQ